ncbi:MAG: ribosome small subunit-dependent GTPase A [Clostridia bacterium]|nr:ribosome small subunit-dependent GTPase A [Clostridia bacterium]
MPEGIILKGIGGFYYVDTGRCIYECKARGVFRKDDMIPLPGDRVNISIVDETKGIGNIDEILARKSFLIRPNVANVDQAAIVLAVRAPSPDFMLVDKLLIAAGMVGIKCIICINKIDLGIEDEFKEMADIYRKAGYPVILLSSKLNAGYDSLKKYLDMNITVFAGQSGVGKSTILNSLLESSVMETGEVSQKLERGRHTTRHAELVTLKSGGYLVDTPGFSSFELSELSHSELQNFYPEFEGYIGKCRFTGCSHISEPGCRVKEALEKGLIDTGRYGRYAQLYDILKQQGQNIYKYKKKNK